MDDVEIRTIGVLMTPERLKREYMHNPWGMINIADMIFTHSRYEAGHLNADLVIDRHDPCLLLQFLRVPEAEVRSLTERSFGCERWSVHSACAAWTHSHLNADSSVAILSGTVSLRRSFSAVMRATASAGVSSTKTMLTSRPVGAWIVR
jgi:hypothetical protein